MRETTTATTATLPTVTVCPCSLPGGPSCDSLFGALACMRAMNTYSGCHVEETPESKSLYFDALRVAAEEAHTPATTLNDVIAKVEVAYEDIDASQEPLAVEMLKGVLADLRRLAA